MISVRSLDGLLRRSLILVLALGLALTGLLAAAGAIAWADELTSLDTQYVALLNANGVPVPTTTEGISAAAGAGRAIVNAISANPTDAGVGRVITIVYEQAVKAGLGDSTYPTAAKFTAVVVYFAVKVYQPELMSVLKHWLSTQTGTGSVPLIVVGACAK